MKKIIESMHLNRIIGMLKKWRRKNKKNDDDIFDHPFAIF